MSALFLYTSAEGLFYRLRLRVVYVIINKLEYYICKKEVDEHYDLYICAENGAYYVKVKYNIGPLKCVSASRKLESGKAKLVIKACSTNYGFYLRDGDEDIFISSADSKFLYNTFKRQEDKMQKIDNQICRGERALFHASEMIIKDTIFEDGESPLKESSNIELTGSMFKWKYPLWYCNNIVAKDCKWFDMARAGVWYTNDITVENAMIEAPKNFRRCRNLVLRNADFFNAQETLWSCDEVTLDRVSAKGDYFAMNSNNMKISKLKLDGNYSFDGCKNVEIRDSVLLSKDAFWNSDNITVYDSFISGEYLGWNAKNLTLINCTIESLQGMCYIDNLVMKNCKLINTTLAFEYSSVDVQITGKVDSVLNPTSGSIKADKIGTLILQKDKIDISKTNIVCDVIEETKDEPF